MMADLRELYSSLGFSSISSYIQSGNVVFDAESTNTLEVSNTISEAIRQNYKFEVPVVIRTAQEISEIYNNNPQITNLDKVDLSKLYLTFLKDEPKTPSKISFGKWQTKNEKLLISGKNIYLYYPEGYGKSKLTNNILERELAVQATSRNWRTVGKLAELSQS